ncbi:MULTISPECIES: TadE/TadG family type IV pilus assembly protein [Oceanobacillus]|uniref:TadE/TadG family type IV pilus assembly protein n=1 Tax=Oceanobacillus TaxID=182709 RepID=UPI0030FA3DFF
MQFMKKYLKRIKKDEHGAFTIEASVIFPILLLLTLSFIFFALVIYQQSVLHYSANTVAERLAFVWDNSDKDIDTGEFDKYTTFPGGDGLYWRLTSDQYLSQFGIDIFSKGNATVQIGSGGGGSLPQQKLGRATTDILPPGATGEVQYNNGLAGSEIVVKLRSPLNLPSSLSSLFGINEIEAEASHVVTEPTEFIRTTDLVMYAVKSIADYSGYITKFISGN